MATSEYAHDITQRHASGCNRRTIDAETALAVASDSAKDGGVALGGRRVDRDHDTTTVAFVDAHYHAADAQGAADPIVFLERDIAGCLDQEVRPEALDVQLYADHLAEPRYGLGRDERQREGVEHAAVLLDHARALRVELCR